jgi:hypothetical protein
MSSFLTMPNLPPQSLLAPEWRRIISRPTPMFQPSKFDPLHPLICPWGQKNYEPRQDFQAAPSGCLVSRMPQTRMRDPATIASYSFALQSYVTFCRLHSFPIEPTPDTLSFYMVYMSHHVKPTTVKSYLSGICSQLEILHPTVLVTRQSQLVVQTLLGCHIMKMADF